MRFIKIALLTTLFIWANPSFAQTGFATCAEKSITTGNANQLDSLTTLLVNRLPVSDFYMVGEAHTFLANNDFQFALIKALHKHKVYNIANELPHSACFLFNQYLETGNDSLLAQLKPAATYSLLRKVRAFNLSLPPDERIKYYGIDYMDAKYDWSNLYRSLQIIRQKIASKNLPLDIFLDRYLRKGQWQYQDIAEIKDTLSVYLKSDSLLYRGHFQQYYDDLALMASNILGNRTNRDRDVFESFSLLYRQLSSKQKGSPRFLAFYGMGHLTNLGDILLESDRSPVKNSVCKIAIQYINCLGGWTTASYRDDGLYQIPKGNLNDFINYCKAGTWQVGFFVGTECFKFGKKGRPDAVMVFKDYGDRKMNSWKFD